MNFNVEKLKYAPIADESDPQSAFSSACLKGHYKIMIWLYENFIQNDQMSGLTESETKKINKIFVMVCSDGYIQIAKQLFLWYPFVDNKTTMSSVMCDAICGSNKSIVRWIYNDFPHRNFFQEHPDYLSFVCRRDNFDIIKLLVEKYRVDYRRQNDVFFRMMCNTGDLEFVQEILRTYPDIDIHSMGQDHDLNVNFDCSAMHVACLNDDLPMVQWLYGLSEITFIAYQDELIELLFTFNNLTVLDWLVSTFGIDCSRNFVCTLMSKISTPESIYVPFLKHFPFCEFSRIVDIAYDNNYDEIINFLICRYREDVKGKKVIIKSDYQADFDAKLAALIEKNFGGSFF